MRSPGRLPNTLHCQQCQYVQQLQSQSCAQNSSCLRSLGKLPNTLHCQQCQYVQQLQSQSCAQNPSCLRSLGKLPNTLLVDVAVSQSPCVSCCRLLEAQEECQQLRKTIAGTRKRVASEADRLASRDLYKPHTQTWV